MAGRQAGFWDGEHRLRQLSERGDPLEKLAATVDFEIFRAELVAAQGPRDRSKGGRPPFDPVLKFRMLAPQAMHGLSLAQTEFLVADRLSWMRFCGPGDAAPDALFARLDRAITGAGYLPMAGQIVDVAPLSRHWSERQWRGLVAAPRQRNTETEKARIKAGEQAADIWPDKRAKARQKDADARWNEEDQETIWEIVSPTNEVFQGQARRRRQAADRHRDPRPRLQEPHLHRPPPRRHPPRQGHRRGGARRRAAARGADRPQQHRLRRLGRQRLSLGRERAVPRRREASSAASTAASRRASRCRSAPRANAKKWAVRAHVEHPFAHLKGPMRLVIRTIGLARATAAVTLANMAYTMKRRCWLDGRRLPA